VRPVVQRPQPIFAAVSAVNLSPGEAVFNFFFSHVVGGWPLLLRRCMALALNRTRGAALALRCVDPFHRNLRLPSVRGWCYDVLVIFAREIQLINQEVPFTRTFIFFVILNLVLARFGPFGILASCEPAACVSVGHSMQ